MTRTMLLTLSRNSTRIVGLQFNWMTNFESANEMLFIYIFQSTCARDFSLSEDDIYLEV